MSTIVWRVVVFSVTPAERDVVRGDVRERPARGADVVESRIRERAVAALGRAVLAVDADHRSPGASAPASGRISRPLMMPKMPALTPMPSISTPIGGEREARVLGEKAHAITEVLPECPHPQ